MAKSTEHRARAVIYVGETQSLPWYVICCTYGHTLLQGSVWEDQYVGTFCECGEKILVHTWRFFAVVASNRLVRTREVSYMLVGNCPRAFNMECEISRVVCTTQFVMSDVQTNVYGDV